LIGGEKRRGEGGEERGVRIGGLRRNMVGRAYSRLQFLELRR